MVDYGLQTRLNTTVATALQRRWARHTRTVLPADAYGRQRWNVVLSAYSFVYLWYMFCGLCAREREQQKQTIFTGTYVQNRPHTEKPGKSSYPLPAEKNLESPPRKLQCSDRAQTSTTGSGRPSCVDVRGVLAKSARTKRLSKTDEIFTKYRLSLIHI